MYIFLYFGLLLSSLLRICGLRECVGEETVYHEKRKQTMNHLSAVSKCLFNRVTPFVYLRLLRFEKEENRALTVCFG